MFINLETIPSHFKGYVKLVEQSDVLQALRISGHRMMEIVHSIPDAKKDFRYADGKWTIREVLCHLIDTERIFAYRALRFARNDKTNLHSFDENAYALHLNATGRSMGKIADEMQHVRRSTIDLFESFNEDMLARKGSANNHEISVVAMGFVTAGHEIHHGKILKERYLGA